MAKVQTIDKARKSTKPRLCKQCNHEIQVGETYRKIAKKTGPRSGFTLFFCQDHHPRTSDTLSGRSAELAGITESYSDATVNCGEDKSDINTYKSALSDMAESVKGLAEEIKESAENMEQGFGHETQQTEAMNETATNLEQWGDNLESHADNAPDEDFDEQICDACEAKITEQICPSCDNKLTRVEAPCETCGKDVEPDQDGDCPECGENLVDGTELICLACAGEVVEAEKEVEPDNDGNCPRCGENLVDPETLTEAEKEWLDEIEGLVDDEPELQLTA